MNLKLVSVLGVLCGSTAIALASTHVSVGIRIGAPAPIVVRQAPPRHAMEVVVVSPGPSYVWIAGHYSWNNNQWLWVPGAWMNPPEPGAVWVDGRWDATTNLWTEGHWEVTQVAQPAPTTPPPPVVVAPAPVAGTVIITSAPPPLRHEHRGHRPGRGYIWVSGYWGQDHGRYAWIGGHWARPPRGHAVWVAPRWEHRGGSYVFIEGSWR